VCSTLNYAKVIALITLDVVDFVLDMIFAHDLLSAGYNKWAILLIVFSVLSMILGLGVGRLVFHFAPWSGWRADVPGFSLFSLCMAEMFVFFVEDGTTILIWSRTNTFEPDGLSLLNLIATMISALSVSLGMLLVSYGRFKNRHAYPAWKEKGPFIMTLAWTVMAAIPLGCNALFSYVALGESPRAHPSRHPRATCKRRENAERKRSLPNSLYVF